MRVIRGVIVSSLMDGIEGAFRDAVLDMPYCSISVKLLCENAGVTRKAFYRRFGGKGDVLRAVFERDVVAPQAEVIELLSSSQAHLHSEKMEARMFRAVLDDGDFYRALVAAPRGGRGAFMVAAVSAFRDFNMMMLDKYGFKGEAWQPDYVASFYANAKARVILDWIESDFSVSVEDISGLYSRMALPFWNSLS